jgi:cytochrome c-type biogenesis protein CcmH
LVLRLGALTALGAGSAAAQTPPPIDSLGRLYAPAMVQQRERATSRDNDSTVKAIERKIRCTCGCNLDVFTCRTTDFTCATSPAMHRLVVARLDSGLTADQILAAFQAEYGEAILMAPPKRGFNLAAYLMPFVGLAAGLTLLLLLMRRWVRGVDRARPEAPEKLATGDAPAGVSETDLERLRRELERVES